MIFFNQFERSRRWIGMHMLRLGVSFVFLWFGVTQITDSLNWASLVPAWASNLFHLPPAMLVMGNGTLEIVLGTLLAIGVLVRLASFILSLHLLVIALTFGLTDIGVRDIGLSVATMALSFIYPGAKKMAFSPSYQNNP